MNLNPHHEYKDSGVDWLGTIPKHWRKRKLRTILTPVSNRNRPDLPLLSVVREKGVIKRNIESKEENFNYIPDDLTNYKVVKSGQFAMNKMKAWQGSYGVSKFEGIVSPAYFVFDLIDAGGDFFNTAIRSKAYVPFFTKASDGVRVGQWDLNQTRMKEIPFFIPPANEQNNIVLFLKSKNEQTSKFIRNKRRLIELLKEQKQAIINRGVTRGLDPNVKLKPSGVDWLGDIPEHWEVRKIKLVTKIIRGKFSHRPRNDPQMYDGEYPFIQTGAVAQTDKFIRSYKQTLNEKGFNVSKQFPSGTLVMTIAANIGDVAILTFDACFPDSIVGFIPKGDVFLDFLYYVFVSMKCEFLKEAPVNTQGNLNIERIGSMSGPLIPFDEQNDIVNFIENESKIIDTAITRTEREIELIREYRTRLISDVVTGKIDVRNVPIGQIEEDEDFLEAYEQEELTEDFEEVLNDAD